MGAKSKEISSFLLARKNGINRQIEKCILRNMHSMSHISVEMFIFMFKEGL